MIDIRQEITAVIEATVLVVAALFPIVNPLGSAAIFVNLVGPVASSTQRLLAQKIAIYSFFLLLCSLLWGVHVLAFFGIAIYAVQIGGGLVVAATGWSLLGQDTGRAKDSSNPGRPDPRKCFLSLYSPYHCRPWFYLCCHYARSASAS